MKTILYSLLFIFLFLPQPDFAQGNICFRQISTAEGLPNAMIRQVTQDNDGFLWIASHHGLYRYDGYEFKPFKSDFKHPNLLQGNDIICLANDAKQQRLWIGTNGGICALDLKKYKIRKYTTAGSNKHRINDICVTKNGEIIVGAIRGLFKYDHSRDTLIAMTGKAYHGDIPSKINIQAICEDNNGDLLIATWNNGIYRYQRRQRLFIHYKDVKGIKRFVSIYADSRNNVWAGTQGSGAFLLEFSKDRRRIFTRQFVHGGANSIASDNVYSFCNGSDGKSLWIATRDGISILTANGKFENFTKGNNENQLPASEIRWLYKDNNGNIWAGTEGGGLLLAEKNRRQFNNIFTNGNTNQPDLVSAILVEKDGAVWTGLWYGVKYQFGNMSTTIIPDKRPQFISQSRSGKVYIGFHDGGLAECRNGRILHLFLSDNCHFIPQNSVKMTTEDKQGNLWVATYDGVGVRYADGRQYCLKEVFKNIPTLNSECNGIFEGADGSIWVTTENKGIIRLYGNTNSPAKIQFRIYNSENGKLPINSSTCMFVDKNGKLWAGTDGYGLCLYDKERDCFKSVHQTYNLPGDMVSSIEEDRFGTLWIGTNEGISRLKIFKDGSFMQRTYTTADGLADNFFEQNASCRQGDMLYFGCGRGYVSFLATNIVKHANNTLPAFTNILMNGEEANIADNGTTLLRIPASVRDFTICFSALNFNSPELCSYAYRLKGYDAVWHYTKADNRKAVYTNLSPGKYTFELKASDSDGNWSKVRTMTIVVEPPIWRTWWAYLIYTLIAVALIIKCIKKIRSRMMLKNKLVMQVSDDNVQMTIDHENKVEKTMEEDKKQIFVEIKDLNFTDEDELFLKNAVKCVNDHLSDADFDIPQFEREMSVSHSTMFKRLKALTGMSATGFMKDIRLKVAKRELDKNPNIRISDLAYSVGFNDPKYFSSCFKKKFGKSPTEYVDNMPND